MSGFAVGFGSPHEAEIDNMMQRIEHRGPDLSGVWKNSHAIMAQNYLTADLDRGIGNVTLPFTVPNNGHHRICLDAQIGNSSALASQMGLSDGPLLEERILLHMYQDHGPTLCRHLQDAIFAFVISDGERFLAARDLLGIKTLFYGWKDRTLYLASELKSLLAVTDDVREFPAGHYMDSAGTLTKFAEMPFLPPKVATDGLEEACRRIRDIVQRSVENRATFAHKTGALLSGGMDSSVITYLASKRYKHLFGPRARLQTFALGVGESGDIHSARIMADHCDTQHHELIVTLDQVLEVLPEVIYSLESFDPSLVRSSVSNYLISQEAAKAGIEILLSGEGGDEIFCGYTYLKQFPAEELHTRQIECLNFLHNNASLRLDRMNQCHSVRVVAPLICGELLEYAFQLPGEYKQMPSGENKIEKWIFRKAFESDLPQAITWRAKQEFSQGSGSADHLSVYFEDTIADSALQQVQAEHPIIRSKEELYYFNLFTERFGDSSAVHTVGQWLSL